MKLIDRILVTETYHLTAGRETEFLGVWKDHVHRIASGMGGRILALYHKRDTNDYVITSHWSDVRLAEKYLASDELKQANNALSKLYSAPYKNEIFEVLSEAVA